MADPFADALDRLFNGPASESAEYIAKASYPAVMPIRVIRGRPDQEAIFGEQRVVMATNRFEIRRSEVPAPAKGDEVSIAAGRFALQGGSELDVEGLTWFCPAEPV